MSEEKIIAQVQSQKKNSALRSKLKTSGASVNEVKTRRYELRNKHNKTYETDISSSREQALLQKSKRKDSELADDKQLSKRYALRNRIFNAQTKSNTDDSDAYANQENVKQVSLQKKVVNKRKRKASEVADLEKAPKRYALRRIENNPQKIHVKSSDTKKESNSMSLKKENILGKGNRVAKDSHDALRDDSELPTYVPEILEHWKIRERLFCTDNYMKRQNEITALHRAVIIDWLATTHQVLKISPEAFYRAIKMFDLYLTKSTVAKDTLLFLGMASLFIASKFDKSKKFTVDHFMSVCLNTCTREKLLELERKILKSMNFDVGIPDSYSFMSCYAAYAKVTMQVLMLAQYILEHSLMNYDLISFNGSQIAAAALYLAMQMKGTAKNWTTAMENYSGYKTSDLLNTVIIINNGLAQPYDYCTTIFKKYSVEKYLKVAFEPLLKNHELKF